MSSALRRIGLRALATAGIVALVISGVVAALGGWPGGETASAAGGSKADVTFTKWITDTDLPVFPWDMIGVAGGDVGRGTFTGEVLLKVSDGTTSAIHALYHFNSGKHSFTADLFITQSDATGAGVVALGVVTNGWRKGSQVTGGFEKLTTCDIATPGNVLGSVCFKGALQLGPKF